MRGEGEGEYYKDKRKKEERLKRKKRNKIESGYERKAEERIS